MKLEASHGGYAGKSLVEKIEDKLDEAYSTWADNSCEDRGDCSGCSDPDSREYGRVEGVAAALGILKGSGTKYEIEQAEDRWSK